MTVLIDFFIRIIPKEKRTKEYELKKASVKGEREAVFSSNVYSYIYRKINFLFQKGLFCFETRFMRRTPKWPFWPCMNLSFTASTLKAPGTAWERIVLYLLYLRFLIEQCSSRTVSIYLRGFSKNGSWISDYRDSRSMNSFFFKTNTVIFRVKRKI